jgi:hypothetical protein
MSDIMIRAESLSKLYKIDTLKQCHDTLRDQLVHSFKSLFSGLFVPQAESSRVKESS